MRKATKATATKTNTKGKASAYPNKFKRWTRAEETALIKLAKENYNPTAISARLGRTVRAVQERRYALINAGRLKAGKTSARRA